MESQSSKKPFKMTPSMAKPCSETASPAQMVLDTQGRFEASTKGHRSSSQSEVSLVKDLSQLEIELQEARVKAESSKSDWEKGRTTSSTKLQGFVKRFSEFLESYSGIVEVLKGADQQYGRQIAEHQFRLGVARSSYIC